MAFHREVGDKERKQAVHRSIRRHPEGCFAVEVFDNANSPELRPGDIVVVDPNAELDAGDFVYIEIRKKTRERLFRQYRENGGEIRLPPLNRNYRTFRLGAPGEPQVAILGKVIELFRSFLPPATSGANAAAA